MNGEKRWRREGEEKSWGISKEFEEGGIKHFVGHGYIHTLPVRSRSHFHSWRTRKRQTEKRTRLTHPIPPGHLLVATRSHRVKVSNMTASDGREMGSFPPSSLPPSLFPHPLPPSLSLLHPNLPAPGFWLPILSRVVARVTGVSDWNIVQNNGARAAQVVPHVHFHIIPRPESRPEIKSRSWTMFGRGQRDDLDDEEGVRLAGEMRRVLREEIGALEEGEERAKL